MCWRGLRLLGLHGRVSCRRHWHVTMVCHVTVRVRVTVSVVFPRVHTVLRHRTGRDGGARDSRDLRQADWRTVSQRRVTTLQQERPVIHQSSSYTHKHTHLLLHYLAWKAISSKYLTRSLAIAKRACDCCIILKSGSYTKAI